MILVTGGAGFIGSNTVRSLVAAGEEAVLLQRRTPEVPTHLTDLAGSIHLAQGDLADFDALLELGRRFPITGIVHLAFTAPWEPGAADAVDVASRNVDAFFNIARAARAWGVRRVVVASTIGVYGGVHGEGALREDTPLSLDYHHAIPTGKKIVELLAAQLSAETDTEFVVARISGTWGPGGHMPDPFFAAPSLVFAAARGIEPDLSGLVGPARLGDALDLTYVKDTGRALALLALAPKLNHTTYNVGSGRATSNADVLAALARVTPDFHISLPAGGGENVRWFDISRLAEDTGYTPEYDTVAAVADLVAWFRAGHAR